MTLEELEAIFEKHSDLEFLKFERVVNKRSGRPDLHAFMFLDELLPSPGSDMVTCAEHDKIWLQPKVEEVASKITEEQVIDLLRCGVFYDEDSESLTMFV